MNQYRAHPIGSSRQVVHACRVNGKAFFHLLLAFVHSMKAGGIGEACWLIFLAYSRERRRVADVHLGVSQADGSFCAQRFVRVMC